MLIKEGESLAALQAIYVVLEKQMSNKDKHTRTHTYS